MRARVPKLAMSTVASIRTAEKLVMVAADFACPAKSNPTLGQHDRKLAIAAKTRAKAESY